MPSSALLEDKNIIIEIPNYIDQEKEYLQKLQTRLEYAKQQRDCQYDEFDGLTLHQYWLENERWANTWIQPKENRGDISYRSGVLRKKLMALVSTLQGLNLSPDIIAYDQSNIKIAALGEALEDIVDKTNELEQDEEKRLLRQYELIKHGTEFVEDVWEEREITEKILTKEYSGQFRDAKWKVSKRKESNAVKNHLPLPMVYLGDISQYFIEKQPFIFTYQVIPFEEAKALYGNFEMFQYVSRDLRNFSGTSGEQMMYNSWRLYQDTNLKDRVEVIKYSDKPNQEFQLLLNGVPMLPIGFPFPWGYGEYNIVQQNLEPIRENFAYGKSFIFSNKSNVDLYDEMVKLALSKGLKSLKPPLLNNSGNVISYRVFDAGKITAGIPFDSVRPVFDKLVEGINNSEFAMLDMIKKGIDETTTSQTFTGTKETGNPTATQITEVQRQARIMLGTLIFSASQIEKKLSTLRLMSILKNWFDPIDFEINEARNEIKNRYRIVSSQKLIDNKQGVKFVVPTEQPVSEQDIYQEEERMSNELNMPVRITALNPRELKQAKYIWFVSVSPKEKKSSELSKLMFEQMITEAVNLQLPLNKDYVAQRFAEVWGEDPSKLYSQQQVLPQMPTEQKSPVVKGQIQRQPIGQEIGV